VIKRVDNAVYDAMVPTAPASGKKAFNVMGVGKQRGVAIDEHNSAFKLNAKRCSRIRQDRGRVGLRYMI